MSYQEDAQREMLEADERSRLEDPLEGTHLEQSESGWAAAQLRAMADWQRRQNLEEREQTDDYHLESRVSNLELTLENAARALVEEVGLEDAERIGLELARTLLDEAADRDV